MYAMRLWYTVQGGHTHVKVFTGKNFPGAVLGKAGELTMTNEEFTEWMRTCDNSEVAVSDFKMEFIEDVNSGWKEPALSAVMEPPMDAKTSEHLNKIYRAVHDGVCPKCGETMQGLICKPLPGKGCGFFVTGVEMELFKQCVADWGQEPIKTLEEWRRRHERKS